MVIWISYHWTCQISPRLLHKRTTECKFKRCCIGFSLADITYSHHREQMTLSPNCQTENVAIYHIVEVTACNCFLGNFASDVSSAQGIVWKVSSSTLPSQRRLSCPLMALVGSLKGGDEQIQGLCFFVCCHLFGSTINYTIFWEFNGREKENTHRRTSALLLEMRENVLFILL